MRRVLTKGEAIFRSLRLHALQLNPFGHCMPPRRARGQLLHHIYALARLGRDPELVRIAPAVYGIVGETRAMAEDKAAYIEKLAHPLDTLVLLSEVLNDDFAKKGLDEPFTDVELAGLGGLQALRDRVVRLSGKANPTTRDFVQHSGRGTLGGDAALRGHAEGRGGRAGGMV